MGKTTSPPKQNKNTKTNQKWESESCRAERKAFNKARHDYYDNNSENYLDQDIYDNMMEHKKLYNRASKLQQFEHTRKLTRKILLQKDKNTKLYWRLLNTLTKTIYIFKFVFAYINKNKNKTEQCTNS